MASSSSPGISIIMPTYNRANYILEAIESIQKQTYKKWELIIVDDGSDDNTEDLITHLNDKRIKFFKAGRIGISGRIKNIGLGKVNGDFIAFIDSDDLWAPAKLEKQIAALENFPEAGFCLSGGYNFIESFSEPVEFFYRQTEGVKYGDLLIPFFKSEVAATIPTLVMRKQCISSIGTFNEMRRFSDVDFILRLSSQFKGIILYEPLFFRRLHADSDSKLNWEGGYTEGIRLIRFHEDNLPGRVVRDALFRLHINFGEKCLTYKKRGKAINQFFHAWKYKPLSIVPVKKIGKTILHYFKN